MKQTGFTLIETLIASVIMFTAIGLAVLAYQSSNKAVEASEQTLLMLTPVPLLLDTIEQRLQNVPAQRYSEAGTALGIAYQWTAEPAAMFAPESRFDPERGDFVQYSPRYVMYNIRLELSVGNRVKTFEYQRLGWLPLTDSGQAPNG